MSAWIQPESDLQIQDVKLAVVGLGYVGLPLAVEFGKQRSVIGFDINVARIDALKKGEDHTLEVDRAELARATGLQYTADPKDLAPANVFIVTMPTPIDAYKQPDLTPLIRASETIGAVLKRGDLVIYESTVYPGVTEEVCVPVLERVSGLRFNQDFFAGYSPERINPGDKARRVTTIKKVTSGSTPEIAQLVDALYRQVVTAGTHCAPSIKVAEAAKVIENTQRDVNIALINEFARIFNRLGIDTEEVLAAAGTKWNFLPFRPGLVGGHCIGVDPYYLAFKAESLGYHPDVILAGRRVNDSMGKFIAEKTVKLLIQSERPVKGAKVLVLGWTFKENVPDVRNTRVIDIVTELDSYGVRCLPVDPHADPSEVLHEYGVTLSDTAEAGAPYDAIILAVKHRSLVEGYPLDVLRRLGGDEPPVLIDVKGFFSPEQVAGWGAGRYWRL